MLQAGWTTDQARDALGAFADVPFPVPVPRPRPSVSAAEAFEYLLLFTTLYISAYHLGSLSVPLRLTGRHQVPGHDEAEGLRALPGRSCGPCAYGSR